MDPLVGGQAPHHLPRVGGGRGVPGPGVGGQGVGVVLGEWCNAWGEGAEYSASHRDWVLFLSCSLSSSSSLPRFGSSFSTSVTKVRVATMSEVVTGCQVTGTQVLHRVLQPGADLAQD